MKEAGVRRKTTIASALAVVLTALALPGSALPQALTIGTTGQAGDGSHSVAPVNIEQGNGDVNASASAGSGNGNAATAGSQKSGDGGTAEAGCVDGAAGNSDSTLTAGVGNCGSGRGGAAQAGTAKDDTNALAGLGCIVLDLAGSATGGSGRRGGSGGGDDGSGGAGGDAGSGGADESSTGSGADGSGTPNGGSGDGQTSPGGPCGSFTQLAGLSGPGSMPLWALVVGALAAFAGGAFFARRRPSVSADL